MEGENITVPERRKNPSALVGMLQIFNNITTALVSAVSKRGGTIDDIYWLATPDARILIGEIAELIVRAGQSRRQQS